MAKKGRVYHDPYYDGIEAKIEKEVGIPAGSLKRIRTQGERSHSWQVSEAGARSVYQIIPTTRDAFLKKYRVDAFRDDDGQSAARVAALHLKESLDRNGGDFGLAVREYHGGPDRRRWGRYNREYFQRVMGKAPSPLAVGTTPESQGAPVEPPPPLPEFTSAQLLTMTAPELEAALAGSEAAQKVHVNSRTSELRRARRLAAFTGGDGSHGSLSTGPMDETDVGTPEVAKAEAQAVAAKEADDKITVGDRWSAAWWDNTITGAVIRNLDDQSFKADPEYQKWFQQNNEELGSWAQTPDEWKWMLEADSQAELDHIKEQITEQRERRKLYAGPNFSVGAQLAYGVTASIADPAGLVAGFGVGKLFHTAGVGSFALMRAGRPIAAVMSNMGEGAIGSTLALGAIDASGDYVSHNDYVAGAAFGAVAQGILGTALNLRGGKVDTSVEDAMRAERAAYLARRTEQIEATRNRLGPDATDDDVSRAIYEQDLAELTDNVTMALAQAPEGWRFHSADPKISKQTKQDVTTRYSLDRLVTDDAERSVVIEAIVNAERMIKDLGPNYNTVLERVGLESPATRMLNDKSPVLKAAAMILLENPTGAGGRRSTAALSAYTREKLYLEEVWGFKNLFDQYRKEQGMGQIKHHFDNSSFEEFERRVFMETERRYGKPAGYDFDTSPAVRQAADLFENGYNRMRIEGQHVGITGAQAMGEMTRGYQPHHLMGTKLRNLRRDNPEAYKNLIGVYSRQFQELNGMDKAFADKLAGRYLSEAERRAAGGYDVPVHLHQSDAADIVEAALDAAVRGGDVEASVADGLKAKYARGGATFTRERLKLDLTEELAPGLELADLYQTSVTRLYRGYARRMAGEVGLAQYGVMGKKGLNLLREAARTSGASDEALESFDQIASEFLNTPFGKNNHAWLDNARTLTTLARNGGMGFTQMAEFSNAVTAIGIKQTMRAVRGMPEAIAEAQALARGEKVENSWLASLEQVGGRFGLDNYEPTKLFHAVPDADLQPFGAERIGIATRLINKAGNLQSQLTFHRAIHAGQVRTVSEEIIRKAFRYAESGKNDASLRDMGFDDALIARMRENATKVLTYSDGFGGKKATGLDVFKGDFTPNEVMQIRDSVLRGANQIIQGTFIGEKGKWAHDGYLKLLAQFRTFGFTSIEKQFGRAAVMYGGSGYFTNPAAYAKALGGLLVAMGAALPVYMGKAALAMVGKSDEEAEELWERRMSVMAMARGVMGMTSRSGLGQDAFDLAASFGTGSLGIDFEGEIGPRGQQFGKVSAGSIVPALGVTEDALTSLSTLNKNGEVNERAVEKLLRLVPYNNTPVLNIGLNAATAD